LHQSPTLSEKYLSHVTHRFSAVKQLLELRSIRSARDRLLRYLSYRLQPGQATVPLVGSLKALAADLGVSPEVLYRTLAQLEAEKVLSRKKGSITFSDEWLDS
ncbi:MAG: helix-turn-helix domain-containing protein, partial [Cyanobacteria bacterium J06641_5]